MPDLSADRPLLVDDVVQLLADALAAEDRRTSPSRAVWEATGWVRPVWVAVAQVAVETLAAAGRLLPPSAEHREEWGLWLSGSPGVAAGVAWDQIFDSEEEARDQAAFFLGHGWTAARPVRRNVWAGPWVEVDGSTP